MIFQKKTILDLNVIKSTTIQIDYLNISFDYLKAASLLNCMHLDIEFKFIRNRGEFTFTFSDSCILIWGADSDQKLCVSWKSITITILDNEFKKLSLLKKDESNFKHSHLLFVPFTSVTNLKLSDFKTVPNWYELDKLNSYFDDKCWNKWEGFIVPFNNLQRTHFDDNDYYFIDFLKANSIIAWEIFKSQSVSCQIAFPHHLTKIKEMFPEHYSCVHYSFTDSSWKWLEFYSKSEPVDNICTDDFAFTLIDRNSMILWDTLIFIRNLMSSSRTKYSISSIKLELNRLSECISVLSLWENCPELSLISLKYSIADVEYEEKEEAIIKFKRNFGLIDKFEILQKECQNNYSNYYDE